MRGAGKDDGYPIDLWQATIHRRVACRTVLNLPPLPWAFVVA